MQTKNEGWSDEESKATCVKGQNLSILTSFAPTICKIYPKGGSYVII